MDSMKCEAEEVEKEKKIREAEKEKLRVIMEKYAKEYENRYHEKLKLQLGVELDHNQKITHVFENGVLAFGNNKEEAQKLANIASNIFIGKPLDKLDDFVKYLKDKDIKAEIKMVEIEGKKIAMLMVDCHVNDLISNLQEYSKENVQSKVKDAKAKADKHNSEHSVMSNKSSFSEIG